jgi:hypothetical protein
MRLANPTIVAQLRQYCGIKEATMRRDSGKGMVLAGAAALALAACSGASDGNGAVQDETATASAPAGDAVTQPEESAPSGDIAGLADRAEIPVSLPKMAYVFNYGFRLPGKDIPALEQKHADMCEAMGPYSCQIVSLTSSGEEGEDQSGKLELSVVSDKARGFGSLLSAAATSAGGEQVEANIQGEEVSKQIVDTEARLRSRIALRDRLMEVLKSHKGSVSDLVQAEGNVAAVNEEIDQANSWLKEMKGRVAYSRVVLNYESSEPFAGNFMAPVRGAVGSLGWIFGVLAALLVWLAAIGGPFALAVWAYRRVSRRYAPPEAA